MRIKEDRIFPAHIRYVIVTPEMVYPLRQKPKRVPGGYLTKNGRRVVRGQSLSFNRVRLIGNSLKELYGEG